MDRIILHSDLNNFYATVECFDSPLSHNTPLAVAGDAEKRHGIILAKNTAAKNFGVKTGDTVSEAIKKCQKLKLIEPNFEKYLYFSNKVRKIYKEYTDLVESFGLDECWLDITANNKGLRYGYKMASEIKKRIKSEIGLTVSIGVSYNKVFAKLGSDYKKPDAITVVSKNNYKNIIYNMSAQELLYVGKATKNKLNIAGCYTIKDLAYMPDDLLAKLFGKNGQLIKKFANGLDDSPVIDFCETIPIKSIGNSTTAYKDLEKSDDVKIVILSLCESVAARLRRHKMLGNLIQISLRDNELKTIERQSKVSPTNITTEIFNAAYYLYLKNKPNKPLRSIGVKAGMLTASDSAAIKNMNHNHAVDFNSLILLENNIDLLRNRFGYFSVCRAIMLEDTALSRLNPNKDHVAHPEPFRR